jgi:hypothetical protein
VQPAAVQECVVVVSDCQEMHLDIQRKQSQYFADLQYAPAQDRLVMHTTCVFLDAVYQLT